MSANSQIPCKKAHHGQNVKHLREMLGIKQEILAESIGLSQQSVSRLESQEKIEDETLEKIAGELHISSTVFKKFKEENALNIISNMFREEPIEDEIIPKCSFNPLEKVLELYEQKAELYERLLKEREERIFSLEKILKERL
jgi:transcriptional regulator with XRE-family HTH domain